MSLADGTTKPAEEMIRVEECRELAYREERGQGFEAWLLWHPKLGYTYLRVHDYHVDHWETVVIPRDECIEALKHPMLRVNMPMHRPTADDMPEGQPQSA